MADSEKSFRAEAKGKYCAIELDRLKIYKKIKFFSLVSVERKEDSKAQEEQRKESLFDRSSFLLQNNQNYSV